MLIPNFIEIMFGMMVASLAGSAIALRLVKRRPAIDWIDHPSIFIRWFHRTCLFLTMILTPLSFNFLLTSWTMAFFDIDNVANSKYGIHIQLWLIFGTLSCAFLLYRTMLKYNRSLHPTVL